MKCKHCNTEITPDNVERVVSLRGFECPKCYKIAVTDLELKNRGIKDFHKQYFLRTDKGR